METRVALISIMIKSSDDVDSLNDILHQYGDYIIGRMGIPYREKKLHIISVAIDGPSDIINALSGKIGKIPGISCKVAYGE